MNDQSTFWSGVSSKGDGGAIAGTSNRGFLKNFSGINAIARLTNACDQNGEEEDNKPRADESPPSPRRELRTIGCRESSGSDALFRPIRSDLKREPYANIERPKSAQMILTYPRWTNA
jgi:hypothetical protein